MIVLYCVHPFWTCALPVMTAACVEPLSLYRLARLRSRLAAVLALHLLVRIASDPLVVGPCGDLNRAAGLVRC